MERGSILTPGLHSLPSTPGEGEAGRRGEEVRAGGGVDRLGCWCPALLLLPPPQVRGGGCCVAGWCQGAAPRYRRRGPHTMVVSSELMVVSSEMIGSKSHSAVTLAVSRHFLLYITVGQSKLAADYVTVRQFSSRHIIAAGHFK
jgi:hypothetical protein